MSILRLPVPLLQVIQNFANTEDQLNTLLISKKHSQLKITTLDGTQKINDRTVLKYAATLRILSARANLNITDKSVKECRLLQYLDAYYNDRITDESIRELQHLRALHVYGNKKVT